jgi:hypothetical protein
MSVLSDRGKVLKSNFDREYEQINQNITALEHNIKTAKSSMVTVSQMLNTGINVDKMEFDLNIYKKYKNTMKNIKIILFT